MNRIVTQSLLPLREISEPNHYTYPSNGLELVQSGYKSKKREKGSEGCLNTYLSVHPGKRT